jgi:hypothetical protein
MLDSVDWGMFILLMGLIVMLLGGIAICIADDDATSDVPPDPGARRRGRAHHV